MSKFMKNFIVFLWLTAHVDALSYHYFPEGLFTSIHILIVDPKENSIFPVKAQGNKIKRETVATLAKRHSALAAINGGFWQSDGRPSGALKIDGHWYGTSTKLRGAIGWSQDGKNVLIDRIVAFRPNDGTDNVRIIPESTSEEEWNRLDHVIGGAPLLIKNGCIIEDFTPEGTLKSFIFKRHFRTAVGIKETGEWVFAVVDGSIQGVAGGMAIKCLAKFLLSIGCVEALNLDGGSSSTMVLNNHVINSPCGSIKEQNKKVEAVANAILIMPCRDL
ncbi:hypothetical protein PHSC3_001811 [Chlamydiales bacterium STE3]|nr:hypothetical protein PHSC3_001811 [Chlamydiales bacterium STE3]